MNDKQYCDAVDGPNCGLCKCKLQPDHFGRHLNWHGSEFGEFRHPPCIQHDWQVTDQGIWLNGLEPSGAYVKCSKGDSETKWIGLMPRPSDRSDSSFEERINKLTEARQHAWETLNSPEARKMYE